MESTGAGFPQLFGSFSKALPRWLRLSPAVTSRHLSDAPPLPQNHGGARHRVPCRLRHRPLAVSQPGRSDSNEAATDSQAEHPKHPACPGPAVAVWTVTALLSPRLANGTAKPVQACAGIASPVCAYRAALPAPVSAPRPRGRPERLMYRWATPLPGSRRPSPGGKRARRA